MKKQLINEEEKIIIQQQLKFPLHLDEVVVI